MFNRRHMMLGAVLVLAGCAGETTPVQTGPNPYTVSSVSVQLAENATIKGRVTDEALRDSIIASVEQTSTALARDVQGGPTKARAVVVVTDMRLRDAGARTFGGVNGIVGQMTIVGTNGKPLKDPVWVNFSGQAKNSQIAVNALPLGMLINAARNSADQESGEDVKSLIAGFSSLIATKL
ncbi:hypothetical protein ACERZ8_08965 [Tateyamaria armeniaca]|uniref:DUF4410 domain-containing protein n=1 Tax=Tateyamaria armeniaca TaxID=2518930 RepID=A0ABW8UWH6_9RHOB